MISQRATDLAQLVLSAKAKGVLESWREYITDQQKQAGISNQELKQAIEQEKK